MLLLMMLLVLAGVARQTTDESSRRQFDVDEHRHADGDDDERPQQAVDHVRLCVDLQSINQSIDQANSRSLCGAY